MKTIKLIEHSSPLYPPRTSVNVRESDGTLALYVDPNSKGERLTEAICTNFNKPYLGLMLFEDSAYKLADLVRKFLAANKIKTLNIAGNSFATFRMAGYSQEQVNDKVFRILQLANNKHNIEIVRSGGQTGTDWAGLVAASLLRIEGVGLFPLGYKQRDQFGNDITQDLKAVRKKLSFDVRLLKLKLSLNA